MSYATVEELEARWRPLSAEEKDTAEIRLGDAAIILDAECPPDDPPTEQQLEARRIVSCEMVKRAMASPGGIGVTSLQQGAGPYQETSQFANPTGDLYLTKSDRRLLGCGKQKAFTVSMRSDSQCIHRDICALNFRALYCSCGADIAGHPIFEGQS